MGNSAHEAVHIVADLKAPTTLRFEGDDDRHDIVAARFEQDRQQLVEAVETLPQRNGGIFPNSLVDWFLRDLAEGTRLLQEQAI